MEDWQEFAQKHYRRNFIIGIFASLAVFRSITNVLQIVINALIKQSHSSFLLNYSNTIIMMLFIFGWLFNYLPQLFIANFLETRKRKLQVYYWVAITGVVSCCLLALSVKLFGMAYPVFTLIVLFLLVAVILMVMGTCSVIYGDVAGKCIPNEKRNRFFGIRYALSFGFFSTVVSLIFGHYLAKESSNPFRDIYGTLLLIGWMFFSFALVIFCFIKEPVHSVRTEKKNPFQFLRDSFKSVLIQDKAYRSFFIMRVCQILATAGEGLLFVYMVEGLNLPESSFGIYNSILSITNVICFLGLGWLGNKYGTKLLAQIGCITGIVFFAFLVCIPSLAPFLQKVLPAGLPTSPKQLLFIFSSFLFAVNFSSVVLSKVNYPIATAPLKARPTYVGFATTGLLPFTILLFFGGMLADVVSYKALFSACTLLYLIGFCFTFPMKKGLRSEM